MDQKTETQNIANAALLKHPQNRLRSVLRSKSGTYCCPKCQAAPPSDDMWPYAVGSANYPTIINERSGSTMDGSYHDWEEIHFCAKCNIEYYFTNGAY